MSLGQNFQSLVGHQDNIIPNIRAAGAMIRGFFEITWRDCLETDPVYEYYDGFEDDGDYIAIKFETTAEDLSYEASIDVSSNGILSLSLTTYDKDDVTVSHITKDYPLWVMTDPDTIANQVMHDLAEDPDCILTVTGVVFDQTYQKLLAQARQSFGMTNARPESIEEPANTNREPAAQPPQRKRWFGR